MKIRLYGTSDDLVSCDGDIEGEAGAYGGLLVRVGDEERRSWALWHGRLYFGMASGLTGYRWAYVTRVE